MYVDRFIGYSPVGEDLVCVQCNRILGTMISYEKEDRPAYRLYAGAVTKKIVSSRSVDV
jgi:hypothetical protein